MKRVKRKVGWWAVLLFCLAPALRATAAPCTQPEHKYRVEVLEYADEEHEGLREYVCVYCGDTYQEVIPQTGHDFGDYEVEREASCEREGIRVRACRNCGELEYQVIPFKDSHEYGDWSVLVPSGCGEEGIRQRTCTICGSVEQQIIPAQSDHLYQQTATPATCTAAGETIYRCSRCGDSYSETIPALGHKWGEQQITREPTAEREGLAVQLCQHDPSHRLETTIPKLPQTEQSEAETTPPREPESETESAVRVTSAKPQEPPGRPLVNRWDGALAGVNTAATGVFLFFIKRDWYVLAWDKRKKAGVKRIKKFKNIKRL